MMATISETPNLTWDPLLCNVEFPYRQTYHPLGFPMEVASNSTSVLQAAYESWGIHQQRYDTEPVYLRVGVHSASKEEGMEECPAPVCRGYGHLVSIVGDGDNQAVC